MKEEENLTAGSEFEESVQLANVMSLLPYMETAPAVFEVNVQSVNVPVPS